MQGCKKRSIRFDIESLIEKQEKTAIGNFGRTDQVNNTLGINKFTGYHSDPHICNQFSRLTLVCPCQNVYLRCSDKFWGLQSNGFMAPVCSSSSSPHAGSRLGDIPLRNGCCQLVSPLMCNFTTLPGHNASLVSIVSSSQDRRRVRTSFTPQQLCELEERFRKNRYIVGEERRHLAKKLSLNEAQVKVWYQNRRTKYKHDKELEQLGKCKQAKRNAQHHVRKWQLETGRL